MNADASEATKALIKTFVESLLKKDASAKWFSNPLKESSVIKKLTHTFSPSDEHVLTEGWYTSHWAPSHLMISSSGFVLHWIFMKFVESAPQISSRFLPAMSRPESPVAGSSNPPANIRQITIQPTELETDFEIPFSSNNTAEFTTQVRDRRDIEETRLRLALLRIKEQRLSEKYYTKYGEEYEDEEDQEDEEDSSSEK